MINTDGKAVVHVNFATDQTEVLPSSKPQLDAIVSLLEQNPDLRISVNGYTDDTGSPEHNQLLSDGRAKAVMTALVWAGVVPKRLKARGFGATSPVAINDSEYGKSQNRRVELVRIQ